MDVEKVNLLKEKGNKAYVDGNYEDAIGFYQEALDSVGLEDTNIAAILHSNISQTYLKKKDYSHAIESATESLKADPSFMKSNLRRATANIELDNLADAMKDLRLIFVSEPNTKAAKDLMRRCSDKPKMKRELHMVYAKHYLRQVLKKLGAQAMGRQTQIISPAFRNVLLRQSLLSTTASEVANYFFYENFVTVEPGKPAILNFSGWITRQFMWFGYPYSVIVIILPAKFFEVLHHLFRPKTFLLVLFAKHSRNTGAVSFEKCFGVIIVKHGMLQLAPVDETDLELMDYYSNDLTRLVYHPGLANLKNKKFLKATILAFGKVHLITSDFLKLWKKNQWPIESLSFVHGVPDLQVLKQFSGVVSNKVDNVLIQFGEQNQKFNKVTHGKLCNNLAALKSVFPGLTDVLIIQSYESPVSNFPQFVQDLALVHEAYETISTKPEWCPKLRVVVFIEFVVKFRGESKAFDVKLLKQSAESLRQKHPDMQIRLCGPRSYDNFWALTPCVHAVIEFENEAARFELAVYYNYPL